MIFVFLKFCYCCDGQVFYTGKTSIRAVLRRMTRYANAVFLSVQIRG